MEQQSIFDNEKRELSNAKDKIFKRYQLIEEQCDWSV